LNQKFVWIVQVYLYVVFLSVVLSQVVSNSYCMKNLSEETQPKDKLVQSKQTFDSSHRFKVRVLN